MAGAHVPNCSSGHTAGLCNLNPNTPLQALQNGHGSRMPIKSHQWWFVLDITLIHLDMIQLWLEHSNGIYWTVYFCQASPLSTKKQKHWWNISSGGIIMATLVIADPVAQPHNLALYAWTHICIIPNQKQQHVFICIDCIVYWLLCSRRTHL